VADAPFAPTALESRRPTPRPALGYALVWSAVVLWSLNAVVAKVVLDSAGLSALRLAEVRATGSALILVAGVATAAVAWLVAEGFEEWLGTATLGQQAAQVLGAVVAGLAVFVASAAALRIEEVGMVRRQVTARWR